MCASLFAYLSHTQSLEELLSASGAVLRAMIPSLEPPGVWAVCPGAGFWPISAFPSPPSPLPPGSPLPSCVREPIIVRVSPSFGQQVSLCTRTLPMKIFSLSTTERKGADKPLQHISISPTAASVKHKPPPASTQPPPLSSPQPPAPHKDPCATLPLELFLCAVVKASMAHAHAQPVHASIPRGLLIYALKYVYAPLLCLRVCTVSSDKSAHAGRPTRAQVCVYQRELVVNSFGGFLFIFKPTSTPSPHIPSPSSHGQAVPGQLVRPQPLLPV